ncbi:YbaB/EbfC family nucleoid-associated protein [Nocardia sp. NPDC056100]|uniref:YbaB/EbfC family nucleoid-associated protein n=1 Tax=Nocardia sp. NPDC056100 TaxID=3345712 RepID=UPI0035DA8BC9
MVDDEMLAERADRIDAAIAKVRGRARSSGGLVVVEVDAYKMITDLRITPHAMSSDPARLATVIAALHKQASEQVEAAAEQAFAEATTERATAPAAASSEWEDPNEFGSSPITFSM